MSLPKVSVLTITYAHENFLLETIEGVLAQQYNGEIEFIIANDNSPDKSDEIIRSCIRNNDIPPNFSLKYIKHSDNKGMLGNFVWAMKECSGKYIALCEGDDFWTDKFKLQKQVLVMEQNLNVSICFHKVKIIYSNGIEPFLPDINRTTPAITFLEDITLKNYIHTVSCLFRNNINELPDWFENSYIYPPDWCLHVINATYGDIILLDNVMASYRVHEGGVHSTKKMSVINYIKTLECLYSFLVEKNRFEAADNIKKTIHGTVFYQKVVRGLSINGNPLDRISRAIAFVKYGTIKIKLLFFVPLIFGMKTNILLFRFKN